MDATTLTCRSCGAGLEPDPGGDRATCPYCGTVQVLRDSAASRAWTPPPPVSGASIEGRVARAAALGMERGKVESQLEHESPGCGIFLLAAGSVMIIVASLEGRHHAGPTPLFGILGLVFVVLRFKHVAELKARLREIDAELARLGGA